MKILCCIAYLKVYFCTCFWSVTACWFIVANTARLSPAKSPGDSQYQYPKIKEESKQFSEICIRNHYCERCGLQLKEFLNLPNSQSSELSAVTAAEACKHSVQIQYSAHIYTKSCQIYVIHHVYVLVIPMKTEIQWGNLTAFLKLIGNKKQVRIIVGTWQPKHLSKSYFCHS